MNPEYGPISPAPTILHALFEWAETQLKLGTALRMVGRRESGTARLEQAVAAFQNTLEVWRRQVVPLNEGEFGPHAHEPRFA
jgi:hypothetical protein